MGAALIILILSKAKFLSTLEIRFEKQQLENISEDKDINRGWESIKENIKTSATESLGMHEMKQHKPWSDEECLGILDQRKQAKMQRIQDPNKGKKLANLQLFFSPQ